MTVRTHHAAAATLLVLALACDETPPFDDADDAEAGVDTFVDEDDEAGPRAAGDSPSGLQIEPETSTIADPTPVPTGALTGIVKVSTDDGQCTGSLIADDTVVTAAHCVCTHNLIGGNVCTREAEVTFQRDPASPRLPRVEVEGEVTWHPGYHVAVLDLEAEDDLAIIRLDQPAPAFARPFAVATKPLPAGSWVVLAGFGLTGADCDGAFGTLNYDAAVIDTYEDGGDIIQIDRQVACPGDSGGPVLDVTGETLYGVHSATVWTPFSGTISKEMSVPAYYDWIKTHTCDGCDDNAAMCQCNAGVGDCDIDEDCVDGNVCDEDVGEVFGYPAETDVCIPEGLCGCSSDGPLGGGVIFDGCGSGTYAACPAHWSSAGCECVPIPVYG